jgi:hypothetical protein
VALVYQHGQHALQIQSVTLLEDGRESSRDEHLGLTGAIHEKNTYHLRLAATKAGATYTLRARIRTNGGTDSHGDVLNVTATPAFGAGPVQPNH